MTELPEKTCSIDRLVTSPKLVAAALSGAKTEQRRAGVYGYPQETFELEGVKFVINGLRAAKLGDMTEASAQSEGYADMEEYRESILGIHPGMSWDDDYAVWVHEFSKLEE